MKHLTEQDLATLRSMLEKKKEELEEQLSRLGKKDPITGEWKADYRDMGEDWDDNVHEVQNFSDATTLESSLSDHLARVATALKRMDEGTYGICSVGKEEIEKARLMITPETDVCTTHAD